MKTGDMSEFAPDAIAHIEKSPWWGLSRKGRMYLPALRNEI